MDGPNKKLDPDLTVYEDNHVLKQVCRKGSSFLETANCKALWEIKGPLVKARWICLGINGSGAHVDWWATPLEVIQHELEGRSGCVHCRALEEEDIVSRKEFAAAVKEQNKQLKRQSNKGKRAARIIRGTVPPNERYAI